MECVENEERVGDAEQGDESDDACVAVQATDFLAHDFTDEFVADNLLLVEFFTQQLKLLLHLVKFNVRFVGHGRRVQSGSMMLDGCSGVPCDRFAAQGNNAVSRFSLSFV